MISFSWKSVFSLFILGTLQLSAEDIVRQPEKKDLIKAIPHIWLTGNLLLLKSQENRINFTNQSQNIVSAQTFTNTPLVKPHFEWNSGVRFEAGYQPRDWTFFATWTHIESKAHEEKSTDPTRGFFPVWTLDGNIQATDYVTSANSFWKLTLNTIDIGSSYPWEITSYFILKPHAVLRTAFYDQKTQVFYGGGFFNKGTDTVRMQNNFFGVGPHIGLTPNILLGGGFSIVGDLSTSALGGVFFIKQREEYLDNTLYSHSYFSSRVRWTLDAKAALSWERELTYKIVIVGAQIGWEWHKLYDQNLLPQNHFGFFESDRNLIMKGMFISLCVAF